MADADTAIPRFYRDKDLNGFKSNEAGRPVFDDVERVEIIVPGEKLSMAVERVKQTHRDRWPTQYAAFKANLEVAAEGWPLEEWPPLSPAQVANLKSLNIATVEQLAQISDTALDKIGMGARSLRDKAQAALSNATAGEALGKATARAERAEAELSTLKANYEDLAQKVALLTEKADV